MNLYETHLAVRNTETSKAFYLEIVQLSFAYRDPKRDIVFLWIGENRASMAEANRTIQRLTPRTAMSSKNFGRDELPLIRPF
jgi:hypothetical protein